MASDSNPAVRREVALSLRGFPAEVSVPILGKLAAQYDGKDRAYLEAIGLGATGCESELFHALATSTPNSSNPVAWPAALARLAWRLHPDAAIPPLKARASSEALSASDRNVALTAIAFNASKSAADAVLELAAKKESPVKAMATWWLFNRKGNLWGGHNLDVAMKERGLYDPANVKLQSVEMPPAPKDAPTLPPAAEIARLEGDAKRGETAAAVCLSCHSIKGRGMEFGPDLTTFGRQQTREVVIQGIAHPSSEISHGYEGSVITTKEGTKISGIILSNADPVIIKSMGGLVQNVPKSRVAEIKPLGRSLMYDPATLGLTPQSISDIAAYLKSQ
jgi:putative heme-binding domain-containing protein